MAFAARLSKRFYDRLGEDIVNELVELLNQVLADSRADLKDLNAMNFERFDAKLDQRTAELGARLERRTAELGARIEQRAAELEARIDQRSAELGARIDQLQARIDQRAAETRADVLGVIAEFRSSFEARFAAFEATMHRDMRAHTRFMYVAWAVQVAAIVGLYAR